ncbi:MAG TPA: hypothetical protein VEU47_02095 [Candidatus Cybelea sp.]|nr:hypothetical protein [Candidatus Cybelea sp.]
MSDATTQRSGYRARLETRVHCEPSGAYLVSLDALLARHQGAATFQRVRAPLVYRLDAANKDRLLDAVVRVRAMSFAGFAGVLTAAIALPLFGIAMTPGVMGIVVLVMMSVPAYGLIGFVRILRRGERVQVEGWIDPASIYARVDAPVVRTRD